MAGHSKWANIKHRKAAQDAKKGKVFTKLIRELTVAARQGGGDPDDNPRLRAAIDKALANNMTRTPSSVPSIGAPAMPMMMRLEETVYEGYGPGGVAVLVECMTDNRNRTVSDVRNAFSKHGGNLGTTGSVAFLFNQQGRLSFAVDSDEEAIMEVSLEAGAEDIVTLDDGALEVVTTPKAFGAVKDALDEAELTPERSEVGMFPDSYAPIDDVEVAHKVIKLFDRLEDLDDVQNVYSNADFSDAVLSELE